MMNGYGDGRWGVNGVIGSHTQWEANNPQISLCSCGFLNLSLFIVLSVPRAIQQNYRTLWNGCVVMEMKWPKVDGQFLATVPFREDIFFPKA